MTKSRFAVVASARSGSNLLVSMLNSHPQFLCHGEVFHRSGVRSFPPANILKELLELDPKAVRDKNPQKFVELVYALSRQRMAVGFKIFVNHEPKALDYLIQQTDTKLIVLDRENRLASYSSMKIGNQTGVWWEKKQDGSSKSKENKDTSSNKATALESSKDSEAPLISFDAEEFASYISSLDRSYARFDKAVGSRPNLMRCEYQELKASSMKSRLIKFLGGDPTHELISGIVKQNPGRTIDRFANPKDVEEFLASIGKSGWAD